ncbi:MAG: hypothetical protein KatS3mg076_1760 [Candidatus Binatia bacterium]|nr:MAG: hypothetical protein KatS3mg076_1760 [Candidatus Binatia bacterium]
MAARLCPETSRALLSIPGLQTAFFSILAPGKYVPSHRGVTKALVRCHLALKVPKSRERCRIRVGGQVCTWEEGKTLFFDDTCPHEVHNDTDEDRVVLFIDFERPMRPAGRLVARFLLWALRKSAYVRDPYRNQVAWEREFLRYLAGAAAPTDSAPIAGVG